MQHVPLQAHREQVVCCGHCALYVCVHVEALQLAVPQVHQLPALVHGAAEGGGGSGTGGQLRDVHMVQAPGGPAQHHTVMGPGHRHAGGLHHLHAQVDALRDVLMQHVRQHGHVHDAICRAQPHISSPPAQQPLDPPMQQQLQHRLLDLLQLPPLIVLHAQRLTAPRQLQQAVTAAQWRQGGGGVDHKAARFLAEAVAVMAGVHNDEEPLTQPLEQLLVRPHVGLHLRQLLVGEVHQDTELVHALGPSHRLHAHDQLVQGAHAVRHALTPLTQRHHLWAALCHQQPGVCGPQVLHLPTGQH
mmetsp:Transcript_19368/g.41913  ORF Transcript_19368/g.41913 Transcript_19368/m.41913 type:complete len:301 (+) Transcript_19368:332-1234(+)